MFMDIVEKYFTGLSDKQVEQFRQLEGLYDSKGDFFQRGN